MKKISLLFILAFGFSTITLAQQIPHYSQYQINDYVLNPAVAGIKEYAEAKSNNRYQWIGITDAPRTYILSCHAPIKSEKMGVGGYVFTDITGPTRRSGGYGSYAYHLKLTEDLKLSMGLSVGVLQFAVDAAKLSLKESSDLAISNGFQNSINADASFGTLLYSKNYYFGITANQLFNNWVRFFDLENATAKTSRLAYHFTAMGGYKINISDNLQVEQSLFVKYVSPAPVQLDISTRAIYKQQVWFGLTYRTADAASITAGYLINDNITVGYAYDYTFSKLNNYTTGSHEVMLGVRFIKKRTPPSVPSMSSSGDVAAPVQP